MKKVRSTGHVKHVLSYLVVQKQTGGINVETEKK